MLKRMFGWFALLLWGIGGYWAVGEMRKPNAGAGSVLSLLVCGIAATICLDKVWKKTQAPDVTPEVRQEPIHDGAWGLAVQNEVRRQLLLAGIEPDHIVHDDPKPMAQAATVGRH